MAELDIEDVRSAFDWVITEFGFSFTGENTSLGTIFRYDTSAVCLNLGRWKGELDVWFTIPSQKSLPPEAQWSVSSDDIARHVGGGCRCFSTSCNSSREQVLAALQSQSDCLRQHAVPILRGDIELLRDIVKKRKQYA